MEALLETVGNLSRMTRFGRVVRMEGLLVEVSGAAGAIGLGARLRIFTAAGAETPCEVVGFRDGPRTSPCPSASCKGNAGARATSRICRIPSPVRCLEPVCDAFGHRSRKGALTGDAAYPLRASRRRHWGPHRRQARLGVAPLTDLPC